MSQKDYIYAVARIRSKEISLLSDQFINQLVSAESFDDCMKLLRDKGWETGEGKPELAALDDASRADRMFEAERDKTWKQLEELGVEKSAFDVFHLSNDYHNLKAAIKDTASDKDHDNIFITTGTTVPYEKIRDAVKKKDFSALPKDMAKLADDVLTTLLHTDYGQLCDIMIDKAALDAIYKAGKEAQNDILKLYAKLTVAGADIKVIVRGIKFKKDRAFYMNALSDIDELDLKELIDSALKCDRNNFQPLYDYLEKTEFSGAISEIKKGMTAFEKWCDDQIIEKIKPELYHAFTIGPLAAYVLGRENEIKTVRIIISGKLNDLPEKAVSERIREMYA